MKFRIGIPVFVLIRPRGGGFVYSDDELEVMKRDVHVARDEGADGIVIGALDNGGRVNLAITRELIDAGGELPATFHRAFDATRDPASALDALIGAGVTRVLTSGGAASAREGTDVIARLVDQAGDRIVVMAGGGVREHNVREIIARTGVSEVHARISSVSGQPGERADPPMRLRRPLPEDENVWEELDEPRMRALVDIVQLTV